MLKKHVSGSERLSTVMLVINSSVYTESTAVLEICARLAPPWSWLTILRVIPRRLLDVCYRFVVRHRYQWFGKTDTCQEPPPDVRARFIC